MSSLLWTLEISPQLIMQSKSLILDGAVRLNKVCEYCHDLESVELPLLPKDFCRILKYGSFDLGWSSELSENVIHPDTLKGGGSISLNTPQCTYWLTYPILYLYYLKNTCRLKGAKRPEAVVMSNDLGQPIAFDTWTDLKALLISSNISEEDISLLRGIALENNLICKSFHDLIIEFNSKCVPF